MCTTTPQTAFSPFVLVVLRYENGGLAEMAAFEQPSTFTAFGLPDSCDLGSPS